MDTLSSIVGQMLEAPKLIDTNGKLSSNSTPEVELAFEVRAKISELESKLLELMKITHPKMSQPEIYVRGIMQGVRSITKILQCRLVPEWKSGVDLL